MRIDVLTTFPEMFAAEAPGALGVSIPARARRAGLVEWHAHNVRAYTRDRHQKTDDRPYGGGPGMVMMCEPLYEALAAVEAMDARPAVRVMLTPQGVPLTQALVERLARAERLVLLAGHYEGIDERFIEETRPLEVSLGDYVISGGELAAMVLIDAVVRLLPGVLGDEESAEFDSFGVVGLPREGKSKRVKEEATARLLDCPHYTKPREWRGRSVPDVLLSGDHGAIAKWRLEQRVARTRERRPDMLAEPRSAGREFQAQAPAEPGRALAPGEPDQNPHDAGE